MKRVSAVPRLGRLLRVREFLADTTGSELLEFALCASLLLMVMFAIIDGSRAVYTHHFVAQAAEAGVRYAATRGSTWSGACANTASSSCAASAANVSAYVQQTVTAGVTQGNMTVITTWPGTTPAGIGCTSDGTTNAPGCLITVQVRYAFKFTLPFLPLSNITMNSSATGVIQQ